MCDHYLIVLIVPNKGWLKHLALMEAKPNLKIVLFDYTQPVAPVSLMQRILHASRNISKAGTFRKTIDQCFLSLKDLGLAELVLVVAIYLDIISA